LWMSALPWLNIRHHFLISESFITPSPYTTISWQKISIEWTFCAFRNLFTSHNSQLVGFSIFLLIFKYYKKLEKQ
jgi:hypothetical protein